MPLYPPAGGAGGAAISAGTQSQNTGTVVFSNSNGISFGLSNGTLTATVTPGAAAGVAAAAAGTQTQTSGTLVFANSNGVTFGMSGSSQVTMDFGSSRLAGTGFTSTTTAGTAVVATNSTNGLSMAMPAFLTTAMQSQSSSVFARTGFTSTTTAGTAPTGTLNTNGLSMAFPNVLTTARASTDGVGLNTAQTNVTWTVNSSGISLNAAGYAGTGTTFAGTNISGSMTMNSAGLNLALSAGAGGGGTAVTMYATSNTTQSSTGTQALSSLVFAGAGIASVGISNGSVVVSVPAGGGAGDGVNIVSMLTNTSGGGTAGATFSSISGSVGLMAGSNITLSQTSNTIVFNAPNSSSLVGTNGVSISTNGSTISVQGEHKSYWMNVSVVIGTTTQTVGQSTSVIFPLVLPFNMSGDHIQFLHTVSLASTSFASTANSAYSYNQAETHNIVMYSRGVGASSMSLQSFASTSVGMTFSIRCSQNTTNNISVTHGITYPVAGGTSTQSFSYAATNSSMQVSTTHMTALTGIKVWESQFTNTFSVGQYWMMYGVSTTQTTQQTANLSAARLVKSHLGATQANVTVASFGVANNASVQMMEGIGSFSTAGGGTTASLGMSNISSSASHVMPFLTMMRVA